MQQSGQLGILAFRIGPMVGGVLSGLGAPPRLRSLETVLTISLAMPEKKLRKTLIVSPRALGLSAFGSIN
jgi:hypothetical protein